MIDELLFALWFFLPAGVANAAPVFAAKVSYLRHFDHPLDFGKSIGDKRVLGDHKTFRGLLAGIIAATIVVAIQKFIYTHYVWGQELSNNVNYAIYSVLLLGPLLGAGALLGDALKSFFKRRLARHPGESWFPFDQIDYIFGGLAFASLVTPLSLNQHLWIIVAWFGLHLLAVFIGYLTGMRDKPI